MSMRNALSKASVIMAASGKSWSESLKIAKIANNSNKTQMIIKAVTKKGKLSIISAMALTGLDKNNLQSRFRTANIATNKVYYDRHSKSLIHIA